MPRLFSFNKLLKNLYLYIFDQNLYLLSIFFLAFTLRIIGTYPGYFGHPDEPKIYDAAMNIALKLNFEPVAFYYGSLLPIIYAIADFIILPFYIIFFIFFQIGPAIFNNHPGILECFSKYDFSFCLGIQSSNFFLYLTRYETAFLSSFGVVLIYFLSKKLFNKEIGLLAALFTAINYRHILSSHFTLADAPLAVFVILSVLLCIKIVSKPSLYTYALAGFSLGLTFSIKYFIYTFFTLLFCHFLSRRQKANHLKLYFAVIIALFTFSLINPYFFIQTQNVKEQFELNSMFYGVSDISPSSFFNLQKIPLFSVFYLSNYGLGIPAVFAAMIGLVFSFFKYRISTLILLSTILPFFYVFLIISGNTYVRNYSAILPLLTIFPAVLIYEFSRIIVNLKLVNLKYSKLIIYIICIILIYSPLKNSIILSYSFAQTNNYKLLEKWILDELPDYSQVVKSWGTPFPGRKQVNLSDWDLYSTSYQSLSELNNLKVDWLILSSESGIYINHFLNLSENQGILKRAFLSENVMWKFLEDNYASLLTRELASFRVKEFIKPKESLDPAFIVIKIPSLQPTEIQEPVANFILKPKLISQCFSMDQNKLSIRSNPQSFLNGLQVTKLSLGTVSANENILYKLTAKVINNKTEIANHYRSKFIRLDFYSSNKLLKTSVSNQIKEQNKWVELTAFGLAPKGTTDIQTTFQIDDCSKAEEVYQLTDITLKQSSDLEFFNSKEYPYLNKPLSKSFIWQPPL